MSSRSLFFFFNDTATTEIYTLSLHDALPIWRESIQQYSFIADLFRFPNNRFYQQPADSLPAKLIAYEQPLHFARAIDRKSTRLNSSHLVISYAVFCLKKKKKHASTLKHHPTA